MQKITTFLWFDKQAEEAAKFYTSIFKSGKIKKVTHYNEALPDRAGQVMTVEFKLEGQDFVALNGGPEFKFTPAISLVVKCKTQKEVDRYWKKLSAGGAESQCGWLTDKYGLSWQVVPTELLELLSSKNRKKSVNVTKAMRQMKKL